MGTMRKLILMAFSCEEREGRRGRETEREGGRERDTERERER